MTGKELGDEPITRKHRDEDVGFCSEDCAIKWDAMTNDERDEKLANKKE